MKCGSSLCAISLAVAALVAPSVASAAPKKIKSVLAVDTDSAVLQFTRQVSACVQEQVVVVLTDGSVREKTTESLRMHGRSLSNVFARVQFDACAGTASNVLTGISQSVVGDSQYSGAAADEIMAGQGKADVQVSSCGDFHHLQTVQVTTRKPNAPLTDLSEITDGTFSDTHQVANGSVTPLSGIHQCVLSLDVDFAPDGVRATGELPLIAAPDVSSSAPVVGEVQLDLTVTGSNPITVRDVTRKDVRRVWINGQLIETDPVVDDGSTLYDSSTRYTIAVTGSIVMNGVNILPSLTLDAANSMFVHDRNGTRTVTTNIVSN